MPAMPGLSLLPVLRSPPILTFNEPTAIEASSILLLANAPAKMKDRIKLSTFIPTQ